MARAFRMSGGHPVCSCQHPAPADPLSVLALILTGINRLENLMATAAEQITALADKISTQGAVIVDIAADFRALREAMQAERENLTPAGQAALDEANTQADAVNTRLAELDDEVGDADGSDTPETPVDPEAPVQE